MLIEGFKYLSTKGKFCRDNFIERHLRNNETKKIIRNVYEAVIGLNIIPLDINC